MRLFCMGPAASISQRWYDHTPHLTLMLIARHMPTLRQDTRGKGVGEAGWEVLRLAASLENLITRVMEEMALKVQTLKRFAVATHL
jgi:hypothetical protein